MRNINSTNFRKDVFKILEDTIKYNEAVNISSKNGNAVLLSEEDYNGLMETLYICSIPGLKESILESSNAPPEEFVSEEDFEWENI